MTVIKRTRRDSILKEQEAIKEREHQDNPDAQEVLDQFDADAARAIRIEISREE